MAATASWSAAMASSRFVGRPARSNLVCSAAPRLESIWPVGRPGGVAVRPAAAMASFRSACRCAAEPESCTRPRLAQVHWPARLVSWRNVDRIAEQVMALSRSATPGAPEPGLQHVPETGQGGGGSGVADRDGGDGFPVDGDGFIQIRRACPVRRTGACSAFPRLDRRRGRKGWPREGMSTASRFAAMASSRSVGWPGPLEPGPQRGPEVGQHRGPRGLASRRSVDGFPVKGDGLIQSPVARCARTGPAMRPRGWTASRAARAGQPGVPATTSRNKVMVSSRSASCPVRPNRASTRGRRDTRSARSGRPGFRRPPPGTGDGLVQIRQLPGLPEPGPQPVPRFDGVPGRARMAGLGAARPPPGTG